MIGDVLFIRSFTPDFDGKFNKYQQALSDENISWFFLGWDRSGKFESKYNQNSFLYRKKALIGGGWRNIFNIICWNWFAATFLFKHRDDIKVLHIIDFDSAIFTFPLAKLLKKKVVFDVYDKYTSARNFPPIISKFIDFYEKKIIENANTTILADEIRLEQHKISHSNNILILENIPITFDEKENTSTNPPVLKRKIGYLGILEKSHRGLEDMVNVTLMSKNIELHVVGTGALEEFFLLSSINNPDKIFYYGPKSSQDGLKIMSSMDIILGFYYRSVPNHLFAAPNKYYEHLMLGKPMLTTIGTPPGHKVTHYNTGWAIEEGYMNIQELLNSLTDNDIKIKGNNSFILWKNKYSNYFLNYYVEKYTKKIKILLND